MSAEYKRRNRHYKYTLCTLFLIQKKNIYLNIFLESALYPNELNKCFSNMLILRLLQSFEVSEVLWDFSCTVRWTLFKWSHFMRKYWFGIESKVRTKNYIKKVTKPMMTSGWQPLILFHIITFGYGCLFGLACRLQKKHENLSPGIGIQRVVHTVNRLHQALNLLHFSAVGTIWNHPATTTATATTTMRWMGVIQWSVFSLEVTSFNFPVWATFC